MTSHGTGIVRWRRHFVALATGSYDSPEWGPLPVGDEVETLRKWYCDPGLGERRFEQLHPALANDPDQGAIETALKHPSNPWNDNDTAVLYITGHGEKADRTHWLVLKGTRPGKLRSTAQRTADLIAWLSETDITHLLVIVDSCYAGEILANLTAFDSDIPDTWVVLLSAAKNARAQSGVLTDAIADFLADLAGPGGERFGKCNKLLSVDEVLSELTKRLGHQPITAPGGQLFGEHPCLPNPHYRPSVADILAPQRRELALPEQDLRTHWEPRSRGLATPGEAGWLFTGRRELMQRFIAAAEGPPGTLLVTGSAGSGKSTALARLVTLSDSSFLDSHPEETAAIPADLRPRPGAVDVAVLATGKTAHEVIGQLCRALDVPRPAGDRFSLSEWMGAWQFWLAGRDKPVTIVLDALDEAEDPVQLIDTVLARLDRRQSGAAAGQVRLLVGVRSGGRDYGSADCNNRVRLLSEHAAAQLTAVCVQVDETPWWRAKDLSEYVEELLCRSPGSPYSPGDGPTQAAAAAIAAQADKSFLVARMAATALGGRDEPVAPDSTALLEAVHDGVLGVFRADLLASLPDPEDRQRALHLLRALAFARGRGLPWRRLWPTFADQVAAADGSARKYGDSDISWLLRSRLSAYIVADLEDGSTVYRLCHQVLVTALREHGQSLLSGEPS